jgi:hypothetical protein
MAVSIPVAWSEAHRRHAPRTGVWLGVAIDADELPERADRIRAALEGAGANVVEAEPHDDQPLLAVHDAGLLEFLRTAWDAWAAEGYLDDPGHGDVVGYIFPTRGLSGSGDAAWLAGVDRLVAAAREHRSEARSRRARRAGRDPMSELHRPVLLYDAT